jgi:hypothetical protein
MLPLLELLQAEPRPEPQTLALLPALLYLVLMAVLNLVELILLLLLLLLLPAAPAASCLACRRLPLRRLIPLVDPKSAVDVACPSSLRRLVLIRGSYRTNTRWQAKWALGGAGAEPACAHATNRRRTRPSRKRGADTLRMPLHWLFNHFRVQEAVARITVLAAIVQEGAYWRAGYLPRRRVRL